MARLSEPSPYVEFDRTQWRALRMSTPLKLTEDELVRLRGLGEKIDLLEVEEVYLPLARLIHLQVAARQALCEAAEGLAQSTDWVATADTLKQLQAQLARIEGLRGEIPALVSAEKARVGQQ